MTVLSNYRQFDGLHWETGTVRNYFDYRGVKTPHTGQPYSEALLMGVSGGAVMGYFVFAYKGYAPQVRILTRNTFDPFETMLQRLGVVQERQQTANPAKGVKNLLEALANGTPALVWVDMFGLPYAHQNRDEGIWHMYPVLVYGYDEAADRVYLADRARVGLTMTTGQLAELRGRVKSVKHRVLTMDLPDPEKLPSAVQAGIEDCIKLYTEKPPKGARHNFGLAAYQKWAEMLTSPKKKGSWAKEFPPGSALYAGLTSAFWDINIFGKEGQAERNLYADFLDEASRILERPALVSVARQFRTSATAWDDLSRALLPDWSRPLAETRELMLRQHRLFLDRGAASLDERQALGDQLNLIRKQMAADFPLNEAEVTRLHAGIAEQVLRIHDIEAAAVAALGDAMAQGS
ncbi:MAG: DUF4872 domain-containing protein [Caldilineaceae bacterium]|nr:DUF4872 domain-containing protein [Caldilineaceae bacterium]HRJ43353.1 BtrH N-terminal domain-containing protein [Caldilineaceae bacterium]